jgi:CDP-glucose 4,6-dehydratase
MLKDLREFYKNKKILILGHSTFMGSWLSMLLHGLDAQVTGCSIKPPVFPNLHHEADIDELITSYIGDIRDFDFLNDIVQKHQPEIVLHLSAVAGYCDSIEPKELYGLNLLGVLNALEVCKQSESVRVFINMVPDHSHSNFFRNCDKKNQGELDLIMGSFRSTEFLTTGYRNAYFEDHHPGLFPPRALVNIKSYPPLGGGDWSQNNIFQNYFRVVLKSRKSILSHPGILHVVVHVLDVLCGNLMMASKLFLDPTYPINDYILKPEKDFYRDEAWVTQTFCEIWGEGAAFTVQQNDKLLKANEINNAHESSFDSVPDWHPQWDAEMALRKTIEWEKARGRGANMQRFSLQQIEEYLATDGIIPGF